MGTPLIPALSQEESDRCHFTGSFSYSVVPGNTLTSSRDWAGSTNAGFWRARVRAWPDRHSAEQFCEALRGKNSFRPEFNLRSAGRLDASFHLGRQRVEFQADLAQQPPPLVLVFPLLYSLFYSLVFSPSFNPFSNPSS